KVHCWLKRENRFRNILHSFIFYGFFILIVFNFTIFKEIINTTILQSFTSFGCFINFIFYWYGFSFLIFIYIHIIILKRLIRFNFCRIQYYIIILIKRFN